MIGKSKSSFASSSMFWVAGICSATIRWVSKFKPTAQLSLACLSACGPVASQRYGPTR